MEALKERIVVETGLSENAVKVMEKRYLKRDKKGTVCETPEKLFLRVAENIAKADLLYDDNADIKDTAAQFYSAMSALEFLPNSPTLMNAGRELQQLSACFVLPIEDSMDSIFETIKNTAMIHKSGGGTGFSFSNLRPKNDIVSTTGGTSSGPISFMQVFNAATGAINQGGFRRGANMAILRVDHPDILDFISCKDKNNELTNFNISVALTQEFMTAVENDTEYTLCNPHTKKTAGSLKAKEVFGKIVQQAWKNGEPGIIFIDRINESNPTPEIGPIESTNPCGEQPLLAYESCNLGSINLAKMVIWDEKSGRKQADWPHLAETVDLAVHFLDNVIDMNRYPVPEIDEMSKGNRKIGLGVMGWADMLCQLEIPYTSTEALRLAERVMEFIQSHARKKSSSLAEKRGNFPNYGKSVYAASGRKMRNATVTTIAPTGTIGIIAGASGGIEPIFAVIYTRKNVLSGDSLYEVNPYFREVLDRLELNAGDIISRVAAEGSAKEIKELPVHIRRVFCSAHEISPEWHIKMQAAFQKHTDNAVSKTVNFSHSALQEDISKAYLLSYQLGCKGVTVYRDRSREEQVLNAGNGNSAVVPVPAHRKPRVRPAATNGMTLRMNTGCGKMYVTINEDGTGICELFSQVGKSGGCTASQTEAISRLVSLSLRSGIEPRDVIAQIRGIRCSSPMMSESGAVLSCADAIAKSLENYLKEKTSPGLFSPPAYDPAAVVEKDRNPVEEKKNLKNLGVCPQCPECGEMLTIGEGCVVCTHCGYSRCW